MLENIPMYFWMKSCRSFLKFARRDESVTQLRGNVGVGEPDDRVKRVLDTGEALKAPVKYERTPGLTLYAGYCCKKAAISRPRDWLKIHKDR